MSYLHGVYTSELSTAVLPPRRVDASLPVVVGTAPIENKPNPKPINEPKLIYTYKEFVETFGWDDDFNKYTLCEFAKAYFSLYTVAPVVFINVYDPSSSAHNNDPLNVKHTDIIGGIDPVSLKASGLELINEVFPRYRLVPGMILAPKFSNTSSVAITMAAKAENINGLFKAIAIADTDVTDSQYTDVPGHKNARNLVSPFLINCWPKVKLGDETYHLSTHVAGLLAQTDANWSGLPVKSPSNEVLNITSAVLHNKQEAWLDLEQANFLNGNGIVTPLNFVGGWKLWGNRTGAYPGITDPKDTFIPVRRMFNWIQNTLILTAWQRLDYPISRRLIDTIIDSFNIWLNGLAAREFILGGRVIFLEDENPVTDVIDGIIKFHVYVTPPSPAREIDFLVEYDPSYVSTLFA